MVLLVSFLRFVMLVEYTELVVGLNIACEGKRNELQRINNHDIEQWLPNTCFWN